MHRANKARNDDAVVEALLASGESSMIDALLALADEVANGNTPNGARGFQAALAQRMRRTISRDDVSRSAA